MPESKLTSLKQAIAAYVPDGSSIILGTSLESMIPFAAGHELIRQKKKNLTLIGPISDMLFDQIVGGGCVSGIRAAWVGNVITGSGYRFRHAVESGAIEVEDHSNLTMAMALKAGAMGVPYMPAMTAFGSDLFKTNTNLKQTICPFTGRPVCAVRAINPDVAIVHVQRSDRFGNAHIWGNLGVTKDAGMSSRIIILTAEEIVSQDVITSDPNRVIFPGFRINAVAHVPWGAYPSAVPGFYNRDHQAYIDYRNISKTENGFAKWQSKWIDRTGTHEAFMNLLGKQHQKTLFIRHHLHSEGVDYGY